MFSTEISGKIQPKRRLHDNVTHIHLISFIFDIYDKEFLILQ